MRLRRVFAVVAAAVMTTGMVAPMAQAQNEVTVWVEFGSILAAQGCVVAVSVDGGSAFAGSAVSIVASDDDTGAVISSDSGEANESGVAWLNIDTSAANPNSKLWASVNVNGSYLSGRTVRVSPDGSCDSGGALVSMDGSVSTGNESGITPGLGENAVVIPGAFGYQQERGLSCEYSALAIATGMLGDWVSEYEFESVTPLNANPHWGYRGDITGSWGNTDDYGIYSTALVAPLNAYGFQAEAWYGDSNDLVAQLDLGRPTLVWVGVRGDAGTFDETAADGTRYQLTPYMHVVTLYGYDDAGVYASDPGNGQLKHWRWDAFEAMWDVMDGMALSIYR